MAKYAYPAIFEKEHEGGYSIYFPDIEGCYTQSEDMAEGIENASDALCLMLYDLEKKGKPVPAPTNIRQISVDGENFVALIACDTQFYKNYFESRSMANTQRKSEVLS
jgi:predicted RNase H-like HicB family nuclease